MLTASLLSNLSRMGLGSVILEESPKEGAPRVILSSDEFDWVFPSLTVAEEAVRQALMAGDLLGVVRTLTAAEQAAVEGLYVNAYGGGDTYLGTKEQFEAVWAACGLDVRFCCENYLGSATPGDLRFPRL